MIEPSGSEALAPNKNLLKDELCKQVQQILKLQEERVHVWSDFDVKFKEYTLDAPHFELCKLQSICRLISEHLNLISMQIIAIKNQFSNDVFDVKNLYDLVEKLQANEQIKFQLVKYMNFFYLNFFSLKVFNINNCDAEINTMSCETKFLIV